MVVSQLISELVTDIGRLWSDLGSIQRCDRFDFDMCSKDTFFKYFRKRDKMKSVPSGVLSKLPPKSSRWADAQVLREHSCWNFQSSVILVQASPPPCLLSHYISIRRQNRNDMGPLQPSLVLSVIVLAGNPCFLRSVHCKCYFLP